MSFIKRPFLEAKSEDANSETHHSCRTSDEVFIHLSAVSATRFEARSTSAELTREFRTARAIAPETANGSTIITPYSLPVKTFRTSHMR